MEAQMKQYHDLLLDILENGEQKDDRTGVGTLSVFGRQLRFDLNKGFPAITTKKLAWKSVVSELLWFLEGSNDERRLCEILHGTRDTSNNTIWAGNAQADYWTNKANFPGDLGRVYGVNWRKWECKDYKENVELVKKRDQEGNNSPFYIDFSLQTPSTNSTDDFVNKTFTNNSGESFIVLNKLPTRNGNSYYKIQYLTGIKTICEVSRPNIKTGTVKNPYSMAAANGTGCLGIIHKKSSYYNRAYILWLNMMNRCHGNDSLKTLHYKDNGIYVDSEWRCFSNFYRDIHGLPGFKNWVDSPGKYDLDKDYYCGTHYSKHTTLFLPTEYNQYILSKDSAKTKGVLYTAKNNITGVEVKYTSGAFFRFVTRTRGLHIRKPKGFGQIPQWTVTETFPPDGFVWRQRVYIDQLANLIVGIKGDPNGRRHILTAWNVAELDQMALPPCHVMSQYYVSKGKLSCHMYQRSVDVFLGLPFNIASYALLTHLIAQVCYLEVGELIISTGDTHIYSNHVEQVKEQLSREEHPLPKLWLNPNIKKIDDFRMESIDLDGYKSHGTIKAEMAV